MNIVFKQASMFLFWGVFAWIDRSLAQSDNGTPFNLTVEKSTTLELTEDFQVYRRVKEKFVVMNKEGLDDAYFVIFYDDLTEIEDFSGEVRDTFTGKTIEKLKLKDLNDIALIADYSVFEDNRLKYYRLKAGKFPVELEYEYTTKTQGNMALPSWRPEGGKHQFVKSAALTLIYPESLGLRYQVKNIDQEAKISRSEGKVTAQWTLKDLLVLEEKNEEDSVASIKIAPVKFSMEGYSSTLESWNGLGKWIQKVNQGREVLPDAAKAKVRELISPLETDVEKIQALYQYLQDNYRYVSIQLGIGGLRPMAASEVFDVKYGDCKALSMFMLALLKEAGIKSSYTLVRAGSDENDIDVDFPSNQFNHVILQVPMERDTVWLECTSSTLPAGFLGDFTMDRHVLVIDGEGGTLVKTPAYLSPEFNQIKNSSKVELLGQGMARIKQQKELTGFAAQSYIAADYHLNERDLQKHLYKDLDLSGAHIESFELNVDRSQLIPKAVLNHETFLQSFYQSTSKRIIIRPKYQAIGSGDLKNHNMIWEENLEILSPEKLELESGLTDLDLSEDYFDYQRELVFVDNQLKINRRVTFHFPSEVDQDAIATTLKQIGKLDDQPIFLTK